MGKSTAVTQEAGLQPQASDSAQSLGVQQVGSNIFGNLNIQTSTPQSLEVASKAVTTAAGLVSETATRSLETVENAALRGQTVYLGSLETAAALADKALSFASLTAEQSSKSSSEVLQTLGARASGESTPAADQNRTLLIVAALVVAAFIFSRQ